MVAASLANAKAETGLRPFDPLRDLGSLADLLETAFADRLRAGGQAMVSDLRAMHWISPLVWVLFHASPLFRAGLEGYVWVDASSGRLVGNASLSPVGSLKWSIGNVAVHPDYRGQGIARRLMEAAIERVRDQGGTTVLLEVHADNAPAVRLYEGLGFRRLSAVTDLRRPALSSVGWAAPTTAPPDIAHAGGHGPPYLRLALRPVSWREWRHEYELALLATPPGDWRARPALRGEIQYRRGPLSVLLERLTGRHVYRRAVAGTGNAASGFDALVKLEGTRPYRLTLLVRPARQAELAEPLAAHVAQVLATGPPVKDRIADPAEVVAQVSADPPYLAEALQRHGFVAELTTVRMALDLRQRVPALGENSR